jgi:alpha-D-ribose 1-methylphosphonate 5-triphosphate diphosphatase PhnM
MSVFELHARWAGLPRWLASRRRARACRGEIAAGHRADLIRVRPRERNGVVMSTWVKGARVA